MNNFIKPILVFYVNVGNLSEIDVYEYVQIVKESITDELSDDYYKMVIPVRGEQETRVDCLNPNFMIIGDSENEYKEMKSSMKRIIFESDQLLKRMPHLSRNLLLIEKLMRL